VRRRRLVWAAVLVAALAVALVAIGRWERSHRGRVQSRGLAHVLAAVGRIDSPTLAAYRHFGDFDCLLYRRGRNPFALELCFDPAGRVVEAIDRRGSEPRIWSVRDDPTTSSVRVDRALVNRELRRVGSPFAPKG
jgi:hypothetical protein